VLIIARCIRPWAKIRPLRPASASGFGELRILADGRAGLAIEKPRQNPAAQQALTWCLPIRYLCRFMVWGSGCNSVN